MPDITLSEALEEAFASAPSDDLQIHTISIYFDGLVDGDGDPAELYFYQGMTGDRRTPEGVWAKDFRIEAGADIAAGTIQEFLNVPFDIRLPDVANQPVAKGQVIMDGVGREVADRLVNAIAFGVSINCTYRVYLESNVLAGPEQLPPIPFNLANVVISGLTVTGEIVVPTFGNRRFPRQIYTLDRFPALQR